MARDILGIWKAGFGACLASIVGCAASAQPSPIPETKQAIVEVVPIGTAGGPPIQLERSAPATLVRVNDQFYLFDAGIGTVRRLAEAGIPSGKIKALFFTHLHPDHSMDLAALLSDRLFALGVGQHVAPLEVYGPPGTLALTDAAAHVVDLAFEPMFAGGWGKNVKRPIYTVTELGSGAIYHDANIDVFSAENSHYSLMSPEARKAHKSFAFKIHTPNGKILITGDTGPDTRVSDFARNVDLMISEVINLDAMKVWLDEQLKGTPAQAILPRMLDHMRHAHLEPTEVGKMANDADVGAVLLTHFGPETRIGGVAVVKETVKAHYSGKVFAAEDLQVYCLTRDEGNAHSIIDLCHSAK